MNRVTLNRRAEEALRHDLQPGERIAVGSAVASDPSRWGAAALLTVALALTVAGLANLLGLLGPLPAGPFIALAPVLGLGIQFLPPPDVRRGDRPAADLLPAFPASRHPRATGVRSPARRSPRRELPIQQVGEPRSGSRFLGASPCCCTSAGPGAGTSPS